MLSVFELPVNVKIHPDFPSWLMLYLRGMIISLFCAACLLSVGAIALKFRKRVSKYILGISGLALLVWVLIHGYFLFNFDNAVGQGGMIWGVIHTISLTRIFDPSGATSAGLAGYNFGRFIGLICMAIFPTLLVLIVLKKDGPISSYFKG